MFTGVSISNNVAWNITSCLLREGESDTIWTRAALHFQYTITCLILRDHHCQYSQYGNILSSPLCTMGQQHCNPEITRVAYLKVLHLWRGTTVHPAWGTTSFLYTFLVSLSVIIIAHTILNWIFFYFLCLFFVLHTTNLWNDAKVTVD